MTDDEAKAAAIKLAHDMYELAWSHHIWVVMPAVHMVLLNYVRGLPPAGVADAKRMIRDLGKHTCKATDDDTPATKSRH